MQFKLEHLVVEVVEAYQLMAQGVIVVIDGLLEFVVHVYPCVTRNSIDDLINFLGCSVITDFNSINHDHLDSFSSSFSFSFRKMAVNDQRLDHDYDCDCQNQQGLKIHHHQFFELNAKEL